MARGTPSSRLLFVRRARDEHDQAAPLAFVVHAGESLAEVRRFELAAPGGLAATDLAGGGDETDALVLVCGHGMRDACCALRGTAVYGALTEDWATTRSGSRRTRAATASQRTCSSFPSGSTSAASHRERP